MDKETNKKTVEIDKNAKEEEAKLDEAITVAKELKEQRKRFTDVEKKIIELHLENDSDVRKEIGNVGMKLENATHNVEDVVGDKAKELAVEEEKIGKVSEQKPAIDEKMNEKQQILRQKEIVEQRVNGLLEKLREVVTQQNSSD